MIYPSAAAALVASPPVFSKPPRDEPADEKRFRCFRMSVQVAVCHLFIPHQRTRRMNQRLAIILRVPASQTAARLRRLATSWRSARRLFNLLRSDAPQKTCKRRANKPIHGSGVFGVHASTQECPETPLPRAVFFLHPQLPPAEELSTAQHPLPATEEPFKSSGLQVNQPYLVKRQSCFGVGTFLFLNVFFFFFNNCETFVAETKPF